VSPLFGSGSTADVSSFGAAKKPEGSSALTSGGFFGAKPAEEKKVDNTATEPKKEGTSTGLFGAKPAETAQPKASFGEVTKTETSAFGAPPSKKEGALFGI